MSKSAGRGGSSQEQLINELMEYPFFSSFRYEEISLLLFCSEKVSFEKDEVLFNEGDKGRLFYAIVEGRVAIRREASGRILAELGPGEVFGEMAVLDNQPRSATVVALSGVTCYAFDGHRLLNDFPHLSVKLLRFLARQLSQRLREADLLLDKT